MKYQEINTLLAFIPCLMTKPKAIYVSTPITTGLHFIKWSQNLPQKIRDDAPAYEMLMRKEVIEVNCANGTLFANEMRQKLNRPVIDPSPFMVPGWTQKEYIELWKEVILQYASEVYFNNGWQYSSGCVQEFVIACQAKITTYDANAKILSIPDACNMLEQAVPILRDAKLDTAIIGNAIKQIHCLIGK